MNFCEWCTLMAPIGYFISRCPYCSSYVHTPTLQPLRICLQCKRIFRVNPSSAQYVKDEKIALTRVKYYRTGKHHKEFITATEESHTHDSNSITSSTHEQEEEQDNNEIVLAPPYHRRLLTILLNKHAGKMPITLQSLKEECRRAGLPWKWALHQVETLIRSGRIVCPKPWLAQLVTSEPPHTEITSEYSLASLAQRVGEILREAKTPITLTILMSRLGFEETARTSVEEALELLVHQGFIFRTHDKYYRWIGD